MTAGDIRPGGRGGRAARRAYKLEQEAEFQKARGVISIPESRGELAYAEAKNCPICRMRVHPTNWRQHMENYHADTPTPIHEAEPGRLPLLSIRLDGGTQPRAMTETEVINDYAEAMREGVQFPAVIVFYDGQDYWLADGFHRFSAAQQAGLTDIAADVRQGTQRDAILFSVGANASHGLRRTNADKQRAALRLLGDDEWAKWSNREIARKCAVSESLVRSLREKRSDDDAIRTFTTKHGTTATMNTAKIGKTQPAQPFVEKAEIYVDGKSPVLFAPKATIPVDRYWEIKNKYAPKRALFSCVYLNGPVLSGYIMIGDGVGRLHVTDGCWKDDALFAAWIPVEKFGFVASVLGHYCKYNYADDGRALVEMYFPNLLNGDSPRPPTEGVEDTWQEAKNKPSANGRYSSDEHEHRLGGRGATVRNIKSGQVGTLAFVYGGTTAYVDTVNGQKQYPIEVVEPFELLGRVETQPPTPEETKPNSLEDVLGGRGAKVRARGGQVGTLVEINGRDAIVDTPNGRKNWDALYLRRVDDETPAEGTTYLTEDANYKRDSKTTQAADETKSQPFDFCQTPAYALDPLLPYLEGLYTIWEPAAGEGLLVEALFDSGVNGVISSDILTDQNFFEYQPNVEWDAIVTNPPFSLKFRWLERCYQLGKPFALLLPVETLGTKTAQDMFREYGVEIILIDKRINFKMPNKGWDGAGAQFPVAWFTWGLNIGSQITFARLDNNDDPE